MTATCSQTPLHTGRIEAWKSWGPVLAAWVIAFSPVYAMLATEVWSRPETVHGALVFGVVLWLLWRERSAFTRFSAPRPVSATLLIGAGAVLYTLGRAQPFDLLTVAAQMPLLAGTVLLINGLPAFRRLAFPIAFMVFMLPLPGSLLDAILVPLKFQVSAIADNVLYFLGYPISRNGVMLYIGPYQLLVANACAGLNSILALSSVGVLYVYLVKSEFFLHRPLLIAAVVPIALTANAVRVMLLVLTTYHFGDRAGTLFHDIAGLFEIVIAFGMLFAVDAALTKWNSKMRQRQS